MPQTGPATRPSDPAMTPRTDKSVTAPAKANPLIGLAVFSSDGNKLGTVHSVSAEPDGKVKAIRLKTGGFLGIGGSWWRSRGQVHQERREHPARLDRRRGEQAAGGQGTELVLYSNCKNDGHRRAGRRTARFLFATLSARRCISRAVCASSLLDDLTFHVQNCVESRRPRGWIELQEHGALRVVRTRSLAACGHRW